MVAYTRRMNCPRAWKTVHSVTLRPWPLGYLRRALLCQCPDLHWGNDSAFPSIQPCYEILAPLRCSWRALLCQCLDFNRGNDRAFPSIQQPREIHSYTCTTRHGRYTATSSPSIMKIRGTDFVMYQVSDLARAAAFYRDILHLPQEFYSEKWQWAEYNCGNITLALKGGEKLPETIAGGRPWPWTMSRPPMRS